MGSRVEEKTRLAREAGDRGRRFFELAGVAVKGLVHASAAEEMQGREGELRVIQVVHGLESRVRIGGRMFTVRGDATEVEVSSGEKVFIPGARPWMGEPVGIGVLRYVDQKLAREAARAIKADKAAKLKKLVRKII